MKKIVAIWILACLPSCALGKLEGAVNALDDAKESLGNLHVAECINICSDVAGSCFDRANQTCVDECESSYDECATQEDACLDSANVACSGYTASAYYECMDFAEDSCNGDCEQEFSDCGQECGDQIKECLFHQNGEEATNDFSSCVSNCVKELEDTLKDIDL